MCIAVTLKAQVTNRPILSSLDRVAGPFAGAHRVENLQVFADGRVVYAEESVNKQGSGRPNKSVYRLRISAEELRHLAELLGNAEIRSLPKTVSSATAPIDFFWLKSLAIARANEIQEINIENFYPFINMYQPVYPKALIELECSLQEIKLAAAKHPKDEVAWCRALMKSTLVQNSF